MAKEAGEFNLIITSVDSGRAGEAGKKFAQTFSLDPQIATQIIKSAPILFATELTKKEVKAITPSLRDLSKEGIEFRVTARLAKKIPKVNWPVRPQFTAGGSVSSNGLAFEWDNNAFVCPGCGETFLFRRLGALPLVEAPAVPAAAPAAKAAAPSPKAAPKPAPQPVAQPAGGAPAAEPDLAEPDLAPLEELDMGGELAEEAEQIELPDQVEEITLADTDIGSGGSPAGELDLAPSLDEAPSAPVKPAEETSIPELEGGELSEAVEEAAPALEEELADGGERYNVFLSKISDRSRQKKAADLIAKVKSCSPQEAKELSSRLVIPLAKGVAKDKAESILSQFKKLKIFGRMTKAK